MADSSNILFKTVDELAGFLPVSVSLNFKALIPAIESAQNQWIKPIVSDAEMANLLSKYHDDLAAALTGEEKTLITKIQHPLAHLTFISAIPLLNLNMSSGGFTVNTSEGSAPASRYRIEELKDQIDIYAQQGLDSLLEYLEENNTDHANYDGSAERLAAMSNFINTIKEMNSYLSTPIGRFILNRMRPIIKRLEEHEIKPILCTELYDDMKSNIQTRTSLGVYAPILPFVQRALAHLAFAEAIDELGITIDQRGAYLSFNTAAGENFKRQMPITGEDMTSLVHKNRELSRDAFAYLKAELVENADNYPLYKNSPCFSLDHSSQMAQTEGSGIWNGIGI